MRDIFSNHSEKLNTSFSDPSEALFEGVEEATSDPLEYMFESPMPVHVGTPGIANDDSHSLHVGHPLPSPSKSREEFDDTFSNRVHGELQQPPQVSDKSDFEQHFDLENPAIGDVDSSNESLDTVNVDDLKDSLAYDPAQDVSDNQDKLLLASKLASYINDNASSLNTEELATLIKFRDSLIN